MSIVPPSIKPDPVYSYVNLSWYRDYETLKQGMQWGISGKLNGQLATANWYVYNNISIDEQLRAIVQLIKNDYTWDSNPFANAKMTGYKFGLYNYDSDPENLIRDNIWPYDNVVYLNYMMRNHTLSHPAVTPYEQEPGWNHFPAFKHLDQPMPTHIRVGGNYSLHNNPFINKPDLTLAVSMDNEQKVYYAGHMSVYGGTHSYGTFNLEQDPQENNLRILKTRNIYGSDYDRTHPTLYTETSMRADEVKTTLRFDQSTYSQYSNSIQWIFTSLPFDCRLSDVRVTEGGNNLSWAIYKHSGQMRADAKFSEVWVKQTANDILHAGEGFIFSCGWNDYVDRTAAIEFPAINNANKNRLFTTEDVSIPLQQYTASAESNRSWNFIGNPYPCFYCTKYFEPSMPFVVYDKTWQTGWSEGSWSMGYKTFSPVDDDYILSPFQGFFVQRPLGSDALNFPEYGRFATVDEFEDFMGQLIDIGQLYQNARTAEAAPRQIGRRRAAAPRPLVGTMENRRVINLRLKDTKGAELDRTRLVGNPDASTEYESICDATKFPDLTGTSTLLYIIGADNTRYAISEQPFTEGDEVSLGAKFPVAGEYTLLADFKTPYPDLEGKVMLIDHETGNIQPATEPYTFTAQAGETTTRFALTYGNTTGIQTLPLAPSSMEGSIFNLQGQQISGPSGFSALPKGMYIRNGKKIIIK